MTTSILSKLSQGDMRTTGKSDEVVKEVLEKPELFDQVFHGLTDPNPGVRMRSADALEKISSQRSELLQPYKAELLRIAEITEQQEIQWHVAQMFSYLSLTTEEITGVVTLLEKYFRQSKSNIVKVMALQTVANIAAIDDLYKLRLQKLLQEALQSGKPSLVSRAKKILKTPS